MVVNHLMLSWCLENMKMWYVLCLEILPRGSLRECLFLLVNEDFYINQPQHPSDVDHWSQQSHLVYSWSQWPGNLKLLFLSTLSASHIFPQSRNTFREDVTLMVSYLTECWFIMVLSPPIWTLIRYVPSSPVCGEPCWDPGAIPWTALVLLQ